MTSSHMPERTGSAALDGGDGRWQADKAVVQGATDPGTALNRGVVWEAIYKQAATLQAQAALYGCTLLELADGGFLICKLNYSRAVPCLRSAGNLLRQIGGR